MGIKEWLGNNQLSIDIWNNKYRLNKDENLEQWLDRVSGGNQDVKQLIKEKKFLFGGRILANRGLDKLNRKITLSNCYVLPPPEDSIESIFDTAAQLARTYSYGGGVGIDISNLRPKNSLVNNAANTTSGSTSFMDFYSYVTGLIGQEGRRGALMLSIDCTHPDLIDFINLKSDLNMCTKANISVRVSDDFMKAVQNNTDWKLYFDTEHEHIEKTVNARDVFMLLAKRNWESAEPGILYWDNIKNYNMLNTDINFSYAGVNPCAEEPLSAGSSCLLGSLNLSEFVENPFTSYASIKYDELEQVTVTCIKAMNEVLIEGMNLHPLEVQRQSVYDWRAIGLGTFGLADMLIKLGIIYGSNQSIQVIKSVFNIIARTAVITSLKMAKEFGCYPKCNKAALIESNFIKYLNFPNSTLSDIKEFGLYNSQLLTCAPTGTTATMISCSTGVEPNYAFSYTRKTVSLNNKETFYQVDANIVNQYKEITGNKELPEYFISSKQINPIKRIKVQATLQKYIDASISSTINLPENTTVEEVADIYMQAWIHKLKGVTIWRDNCNRESILSENNKKETVIESNSELQRGEIVKAGDDCIGLKRTITTGCGTLHITSYWDRYTGELRESYLSKGSTGGCHNFMIGLSRMISLAARGGIGLEAILDQLKSCGVCPSYAVRSATKKDTSKGSCCPVAVGLALKEMSKEIQDIICECTNQTVKQEETETSTLEECPNCHEKTLIHEGGCIQCTNCGYSKCS